MRTSSDHILTSHVGSLPRPDDLIEANRARDEGAAVDEAHSKTAALVARRRAPPEGTRHRRSKRRRVRQVDGAAGQLRRLVELRLPSPGRPRARRGRASTMRAASGAPGELVLTERWRPARPRALRRRLYRPRIRHFQGPRPSSGRSASGRDLYRTRRNPADIAHFKAALTATGVGKAS